MIEVFDPVAGRYRPAIQLSRTARLIRLGQITSTLSGMNQEIERIERSARFIRKLKRSLKREREILIKTKIATTNCKEEELMNANQ